LTKRQGIAVLACTLSIGVASWLSQPASADSGLCEIIADQSRTIDVYREIAAETPIEDQPLVLRRIEQLQAERESTMRLLGEKECEN
jgi:hypothetical protein